MTISSAVRTAGPFIGNGATQIFPFTFKVYSRSDLLVAQTVTATGVETIKTLDADYTVFLNVNQDTNPGGLITMVVAPPAGTTLAATSNIALVQSLDLTNQGGFYPKVINDALDRIVINIQQLAGKIGQGLGIGQAALTDTALAAIALVQEIGSNAGSSLIGFIEAGVGATTRSLQDRLRDMPSANGYQTIQQAVDAAGANGCIVIPANYAGTDSYSNPNNISILDMRHGALGVHSWIQPSYPVAGYPQGHDLVLRAAGPADTHIEKWKTAATTTTALAVGANNNVPISAVVTGNLRTPTARSGDAYQFSPSAGLYIGRNTPNEEYVNIGSWSIIDGTHLSITCVNAHAGTVDIEQIGSTLLASPDLFIVPNTVNSANATYSPSLRVKDLHGTTMFYVPGNLDPTAGIYQYLRWNVIHSGENGINKDFVYRHQLATSSLLFKDYTGAAFMTLDGVGQMTLTRGVEVQGNANIVGTAGALQLGKTSAAITSTTDAHLTWQNSTDPLNSTATAGSVLLSARNIANTAVHIATQGTLRMRIGAAGVEAGSDNGISLGSATRRFSTVYAASGTINTSDQREKTPFTAIPDAVLDAWGEVRQQIGVYQWLDAIAEKGEAARLHFGIPAQAIDEAFARHGLDANRYGLFCEDPTFRTVTTTRTERRQKTVLVNVPDFVFEAADGQMVRKPITRQVEQLVTEKVAIVDQAGHPVMESASRAVLDDAGLPKFDDGKPVTESIEVPMLMDVPVYEDVEIKVEEQVPTGDVRKGVRVDECMWLDAAWVRRKLGA